MDSTSLNWDSIRRRLDKIRWHCWTVHDDFFNKKSWILGTNKSKLGQYKTIFEQYKSNRTVQDNNSTKLGEIFGQYIMILKQIKLKCGYVQVEIRTVRDENWVNYWDITRQFWTVQVEIRTVRDAESTKSGEILDSTWWFFLTN